MRGGIVVAAGKDLEAARAALARAVASGALGAGMRVRRDGDGVAFEGTGGDADGGRITVTADGRATYEVRLRRLERRRIGEAVAVAVFVAVTGALGWSLLVATALPTGIGAGAAYAIARIVGDRARWRRRVDALVASLPVLVDA
jgi:hypothetical protein